MMRGVQVNSELLSFRLPRGGDGAKIHYPKINCLSPGVETRGEAGFHVKKKRLCISEYN